MPINNTGDVYLSGIFVSRNDNHGGDMMRRMQACFNSFIRQCERTRLDAELLIVEWNPPEDRPLLAEAMQWPSASEYVSIRILTVGHDVHRRYLHSDALPMNIPVAKNVGLRHARGQFVLQSCVDNLFNDPLFDELGKRQLDTGVSYRVDRFDVEREILSQPTLAKQLAWATHHVMKIYQKMDLRKEFPAISQKIPDVPQVHANGSGDFQLMSRMLWHKIGGYWENDLIGYGIDVLAACMAYYAGAREVTFGEPCRLYHIDHDVAWRRPDWILGHPAIYHLKEAFNHTPVGMLFKRLFNLIRPRSLIERQGIDVVNIDWIELIRQVHSGERSFLLNENNWGLADFVPTETIICRQAKNSEAL